MQSRANDSFQYELLLGVHDALDASEYHLAVGMLENGADAIPALVAEHRVDGVLAWTRLSASTGGFICQHVPTVLMMEAASPALPADSVMADAAQAMHQQLAYLWELGHRRIAYFEQMFPTPSQQARLGAFNAFFAERGLPLPCPGLCVPRETHPDIHQQVLEAYVRELLAAVPRPTALIAACSYARDLMYLLLDQGVRIPDDLSVIGANDFSYIHLARPALTHYRMPMAEVGRTAVRLLLERLDDPDRPHHRLLLEGKPIERSSCAALAESSDVCRGAATDALSTLLRERTPG